MFYNYSQNNSGGSFYGVTEYWIEADSPDEADDIAEMSTDIYFNGCDTGMDCSCCGDRWYRTESYAAAEEPLYRDIPVDENLVENIAQKALDPTEDNSFLIPWWEQHLCVVYSDGTRFEVKITQKDIEDLNQRVRDSKNKLWCFKVWGISADKPLLGHQGGRSMFRGEDVDADEYWSEDGNNFFYGIEGWSHNKNWSQFVAGSKKEVDEEREKFVAEFSVFKRKIKKLVKDHAPSEVAAEIYLRHIS